MKPGCPAARSGAGGSPGAGEQSQSKGPAHSSDPVLLGRRAGQCWTPSPNRWGLCHPPSLVLQTEERGVGLGGSSEAADGLNFGMLWTGWP